MQFYGIKMEDFLINISNKKAKEIYKKATNSNFFNYDYSFF